MRERPPVPLAGVTIDVHLADTSRETALADDVFFGLRRSPKELPPKWFYDERGSRLFSKITTLPEYYLTGAERQILADHAADISRLTRARTLVELGSGTSEKTRLLLDALTADGLLELFTPFDVSEEVLCSSAARVAAEYPGVSVRAIVGDFDRHLDELPTEPGPVIVAFLGSSVGNMYPEERHRFFSSIRRTLGEGDSFLLGADLIKDRRRLEAAYNDQAGVSAEFNLNVLHVLNNELDADFPVDNFEHVARFDERNAWMEMSVRCRDAVTVHLGKLDMEVDFAAGELMRTEISTKFRTDQLAGELRAAGFNTEHVFTDTNHDFALLLAKG